MMAKKQEEVSVLVIQMCTEILEIASNRSQQYHSCNCANPGRSHVGSRTSKQRATYKILGRALRDEFYLIFYERQTQYFTCCWGLLSQLRVKSTGAFDTTCTRPRFTGAVPNPTKRPRS
ncbi:hypothetical protein LY78DRAFT_156809 [Colletotrichum sublineola]|nr:hypothetical protein LY78DRAFT_156809 [Colletotrichum sublineola]